ncbi:TPA: inovirus Gp2 family protein [Serratia marcescens]|uniref:inovirus Gp2 family protein n=1 Tax=Serratia marcescens TaxID=615 RepID=UPI0014959E36|nr:inovirus Gp2 family protein [Serratia marcescens]MDF8319154.1 inovirus Gp2 family protein [Serratia nevei]EGT0501993.1 inovirus Gp2 family protein [Serratia marcescens]EHT9831806.1 inovirus Gp2 family protein [Serratia marcescens]EIU0973011.1 inovirus Gp2 family protein [Serratia marcescens]EMB7752247.1 inovirus Gp2 family protein [Serratia marcescens]
MSINTNSYGTLNKNYVKRIQDTITKALNEYPRVMVLRVDLRLPEIETGSYKNDSGIVTRFIVSLKAQIEADLLKKCHEGKRVHSCRVRHIWAREFNECGKKHYHVALLFNREAYAYPGRYTSINGNDTHNLAMMIMEAWVRALGLNSVVNHQQYYPLVEFPVNGYYHLSKKNDFTEQLATVTDRLNYLAKNYSKDNSDGQRNFGCSQY